MLKLILLVSVWRSRSVFLLVELESFIFVENLEWDIRVCILYSICFYLFL